MATMKKTKWTREDYKKHFDLITSMATKSFLHDKFYDITGLEYEIQDDCLTLGDLIVSVYNIPTAKQPTRKVLYYTIDKRTGRLYCNGYNFRLEM